MTTPFGTPARTRGQQLAAQAAEAAEVRDALTHPDVVALRVETLRGRVDRFIWTGMILGLLFTMTNVQQFTAHTLDAGPGSLGWWAAWLLDPTVSVILLGVLLAEREVSRWQVPVGPWARAAKWSLLAATYVMNTWESWAAGNLAGIVLHSVPPLAVFMGAEAVTDCQNKLTEAVHRAHTWATQRADRKAQADRNKHAAEQAQRPEQVQPAESAVPTGPVAPAPVPPPAPAPFPVVTNRPGAGLADRSGPVPAVRSADRSDAPPRSGSSERPAERPVDRPADRPGVSARGGSTRRRSGTPRTDAQLSRVVRELAEGNGGAPRRVSTSSNSASVWVAAGPPGCWPNCTPRPPRPDPRRPMVRPCGRTVPDDHHPPPRRPPPGRPPPGRPGPYC